MMLQLYFYLTKTDKGTELNKWLNLINLWNLCLVLGAELHIFFCFTWTLHHALEDRLKLLCACSCGLFLLPYLFSIYTNYLHNWMIESTYLKWILNLLCSLLLHHQSAEVYATFHSCHWVLLFCHLIPLFNSNHYRFNNYLNNNSP